MNGRRGKILLIDIICNLILVVYAVFFAVIATEDMTLLSTEDYASSLATRWWVRIITWKVQWIVKHWGKWHVGCCCTCDSIDNRKRHHIIVWQFRMWWWWIYLSSNRDSRRFFTSNSISSKIVIVESILKQLLYRIMGL